MIGTAAAWRASGLFAGELEPAQAMLERTQEDAGLSAPELPDERVDETHLPSGTRAAESSLGSPHHLGQDDLSPLDERRFHAAARQ